MWLPCDVLENMHKSSIHILFVRFILWGLWLWLWGELKPIPAGWETGCTLVRSPSYHRVHIRDNHPFMKKLKRKQGEDIETLDRKTQTGNQTGDLLADRQQCCILSCQTNLSILWCLDIRRANSFWETFLAFKAILASLSFIEPFHRKTQFPQHSNQRMLTASQMVQDGGGHLRLYLPNFCIQLHLSHRCCVLQGPRVGRHTKQWFYPSSGIHPVIIALLVFEQWMVQ